jgi:hypothetical protein
LKFDPKTADPTKSGLIWVKNDKETGIHIEIPEYQIPGIKAADEDRHYAELSLLQDAHCAEELGMVASPAMLPEKTFPEAPKESTAWNAWSSSYKFVLGSVPPTRMHWWENEQKTQWW